MSDQINSTLCVRNEKNASFVSPQTTSKQHLRRDVSVISFVTRLCSRFTIKKDWSIRVKLPALEDYEADVSRVNPSSDARKERLTLETSTSESLHGANFTFINSFETKFSYLYHLVIF